MNPRARGLAMLPRPEDAESSFVFYHQTIDKSIPHSFAQVSTPSSIVTKEGHNVGIFRNVMIAFNTETSESKYAFQISNPFSAIEL